MDSEKLGIAAHLHVLLRRKTGRVTDTEWLASNAEYAQEIIRFAHVKAVEDSHPDLAEWADKLAAAMSTAVPTPAKPLLASLNPGLSMINAAADVGRYVRGLR
jgi:hypothetical protein